MVRIAVFGGTGYAGSHILRTAVDRGHEVISYSRSVPAETIAGVSYRAGSIADPAVVAEAVSDADVVVSAVSPRGAMAGAT
ncbi:NAD(P)H-binding protein, partial [Microbacterium sp. NPDC055683]